MEKKSSAKKAVAPKKTSAKTASKPKASTKSVASKQEKATVKQAAPSVEKKKVSGAVVNTSLAHGVGRRKSAVARVWLSRGSGKIVVNDKEYTRYFDTEIARLDAARAFEVCPVSSNYDVKVNVQGGGPNAQAGAVRLGVSRAIVSIHEEMRSTLRKHGLLTVDPRLKERKKYGQRGARRKFQFVKR